MANTRFVKPAPGIVVRRPDFRYERLPESGALVTWSPFYQRRLDGGDIVVVVDGEANAEPKTEEPADPKGKQAKGGNS